MGSVRFPGPKDTMIRVCYYRWFIWMEYIYIYITHVSYLVGEFYQWLKASFFLLSHYSKIPNILHFIASSCSKSIPQFPQISDFPSFDRLGRQRQRADVALQQRLGLCGFIPGWC